MVVFLGTDDDDLRRCTRLADRSGKIPDLFVTPDRLAVLHPCITKMTGQIPVEIDTRDDQWSEKIPFPAFINAKVRLELLR